MNAKTSGFASVFVAIAALACAAAPDLTSSLEYLSNPASSRWPSSAISRHVQDLQPHRGMIYTSGGEWGNNTGPCPCFAVDPYSGAYTNEFSAGTDAIYEFKEFSDGRLYTSAIDIHEGAANEGHTFRRSTNGQWTALKTCNVGSITNLNWQGYYIHNWDMAEYKKWTFVCGYGISGSTNRCETKMFNATPSLKDCYRICKPGYVYTNELGWVYHYTSKQLYRRFCAFLPFDDDCFAIPAQPTRGMNIQQWDFEEWRWDEEKNQFLCQTNTWSRMAPGVTAEMASFHYPSNESYTVQLWHPTKFKDRVLYILGGHDYNVTPWAAFSAVNENHHIKATRIELGGADVKPFDIYAHEDAVFLVAAQAGPASSTVTNSVWKSTDGVNFTKLFTFTRTRQASALCYYDGHFYFGMGSNADTKMGWPKVTGTEVAGNIYRIPYQLEPLGVEAETNRLSCAEGATGTVRFRLTAAPVTNVTLSVRSSANPAITVQTTSLAFTPGDWNTWKTVTYEIAENTDVSTHPTGAIICGADGVGIASGSARVTVVDNDAVPAASGLAFSEITDTSARATANVTDLGKLNGAVNASVRVAFELFTDAKYTNLVTAVTNTVTATGNTSATLGGLVHDTRYALRVTVLGGGGLTAILAGQVVTDEEPIPNEDQIPERRNYLVYEGFSTNDYKVSTGQYGTTIQSGPTGTADSIGTAAVASKWGTAGSNQLLWYKPTDGLRLPRTMRAAGFKSRGTSVGTNPGANAQAARGAYRQLADGVLAPSNTSTGRYCFRVLLNVDGTAYEAAKKEGWLITTSNTTTTSVNAYGAGFCRAPTANNYGVHLSEPSTIGFYIARNTNNVARAYMRTVSATGEINSKVLGEVKTDVTYIFYAEAELKDGADIIRGGYQSVTDYTTNITWMAESTNDVFTASSYPTAMMFGGCYGTNGGYFRADEFAVGTKLADVLAVAGDDLGDVGTDPEPGSDPDPEPGPGTDPEPGESQVNYWIAAEGSDGLASTAANWSAGAPTASSDVVVSPTNSSVTLVWDAAATQTINSYHQYGLTNEVRTTFSTDFPVLTVKGDLVVEGGVLTHPRGAVNVSANVSRLKLSVGGDFILGTNATVNLKGKGLAGGQKPSGSTAGSHAASCDGYSRVYGNVYRPEHPGSGSNGANNWGGGALWLEVAGAATIDGTITVRPEEKDNIKQPAAGSVYVKAAACSGTGYIYADYAATGYYNGGAGSGGRVAIELTEATALELAESHISAHGINAGGSNGGGGTIFVKTADPTMSNGTLILDDTRTKSYGARWHKPTAVTAIPAGETWTFDAIKIKNYGVLAIPAGTKLVLPKGIASVTASSTRQGGLLYQGGEIDWGKGPYEFAQPWIFQANKPFTFDGNVTVKQNGCLGCLQFMGSTDLSDYTKCDIIVNGDLTVEQGGYVWAESAGPDLNVDRTTSAYHGGQTGSLSYAAAYDSILDPTLPGWGMSTGDRATSQPGGGVLKLTVNGALTVDGTITAYANKNGNNSEGAGGTVNIRAKTLSGAGKITADCYKFTSQQYSGGGGRIAVRLSEQAIGTDGIFSRITAKGATVVTSGGYKPSHSSSAGTVYLQGKDDAEGAGTVRVCNDANELSVDPYTPFPTSATAKGADEVEALKDVTLFIGDCAKVRVQVMAEIRGLALDATGRLDLNGQTLTVTSATVNGQAVAAGTYAAGAAGTWLLDSSEDGAGRLVVTAGAGPSIDPELDVPTVVGSSVGVTSGSGDPAGSRVFSVSVGNVKAGLYYTIFTTESLDAPFVAGACIQATAEDVEKGLSFELPVSDRPSLFAKIVVSATPYEIGSVLK